MLSPWKKLDDFMMEFLVFWHALEKQSEAPTVVCAISPFSPFVLSLNSLYLAPKCLSPLEAFRVAFHCITSTLKSSNAERGNTDPAII